MTCGIAVSNPWARVFAAFLVVATLTGSFEASAQKRKKQEEKLETPATGTTSSQPASGGYTGPKKIIAVSSFSSSAGIDAGAGEGMTAMLSEELMRTGRFMVVERAQLDAIISEQDLGAEGRTNPQTAAKIGEMLGASILVMGTVTQFEQTAASAGGGVGIPIPGVGAVGLGGKKSTGYVKINLRLVDTTTGQILSTTTADGTFTGKSGLGAAYIKGFAVMGSKERNEPVGQAAEDAIRKAVAYIESNMASVPFSAKVAEVDGTNVYINAGSTRNVQPGMVLNAHAVVKEIKDPDTGLILDSVTERTGSIEVVSVKENMAICRIVDGSINMGQVVRTQ